MSEGESEAGEQCSAGHHRSGYCTTYLLNQIDSGHALQRFAQPFWCAFSKVIAKKVRQWVIEQIYARGVQQAVCHLLVPLEHLV